MTVAITTRKKLFSGNGTADEFAFTFKVFAKADLSVAKISSAGAETPLVLDSDFSVVLNADQNTAPGGTVTYPISGAKLATGESLIVLSAQDTTQSTDLQNAGGFFPETIENRLDALTIGIQQNAEKLARAVLASAADVSPVLSIGTAAARADKYLAFDSNGDAEPAVAVGTTALTEENVEGVLTQAGIGRTFYPISTAESASGLTDDDLTDEYYYGDVRRYGAVLDSTDGTDGTDDTVALQAWLDVGGKLYGVPGATARITAQIEITADDTHIDGRGMEIAHDAATIESVIYATQRDNVTIENLKIDGQKSQKSASGVAVAYGLEINGSTKVRIAGNYVHDTYEHGIRVGSINNTDLVVESTEVIIHGNVVEDCGNAANGRGYGIWTFGLIRRQVITSNIIVNCFDGGITTDETSTGGVQGRTNFDVIIADNTVQVDDTDSVGIRFEGTARGSITGNVVKEALFGLIVQEGQAADGLTSHVVVSGNVFRGAGNGARFINIRDVVIDSNIFEMYDATGTAGIEMYNRLDGEDSARVSISNNIIKSKSAGIMHGDSTSHNGGNTVALSITGNSCFCTVTTPVSGDEGIKVDKSQDSIVAGNKVYDFLVGLRSADGATWENNEAFDCTALGMSLTGTDSRIVRGNVMHNNIFDVASASNLFTTYLLENHAPTTSGSFSQTYRRGNIGPSNLTDIHASSTTIADVASTLNTAAKHAGMVVWDVTSKRTLRASGPAAGDAWDVTDGSASVTPV